MKEILEKIQRADIEGQQIYISHETAGKLRSALERLEYIAQNDDMHTGEATRMARMSFPQEEVSG